MKFVSILPLALVLNQSAAFVHQQRAFVRPNVATFMSEVEEEEVCLPLSETDGCPTQVDHLDSGHSARDPELPALGTPRER